MQHAKRASTAVLLGLALCLAPAMPAWAVYKVVGPNGGVTFTDVPPAGSQAAPVTGLPPASPRHELPEKLRQLQQQAPVVIYTTPNCKACDDGVRFLRGRGIPYTEKSVETAQDAQAFKAMDPEMRVPLLSVAGVDLPPGFDAGAWGQTLNAAGYPAKSELPPGYRFALPRPLVPASHPAAGTRGPSADPGATAAQPSVLPPPNPNAPPGFKF